MNKQGLKSRDYLDRLMDDLAAYQTKTSPLSRDLNLSEIFKDAYGHRVIKQNNRKKIIFVNSALGNFFIKQNFLTRRKDRLRHLCLPRRRWAEWHNLHKLNALGLEAAEPVIGGQNFNEDPGSFFIITKAVDGQTLHNDRAPNAALMGAYLANLHQKGFYYADLHPQNLIIKPDGQPVLIDAQEIFFLKKLPGRLRSYNLGRLYLALRSTTPDSWFEEFLRAYNRKFKKKVHVHDIRDASARHYKKHIKSRTRRCLKNTSEFQAIATGGQKIYRRKDFVWNRADILHALKYSTNLKENKVVTYESVCIKIHAKGRLHKDRCLASWINSRALDMHGINVPKALGYFKFNHKSYFMAEYLKDGMPLYKFLPTLVGEKNKNKIIKQLARWVRNIHDHQIWQKDFNSTNVLHFNHQFILLDLDNVRLSGLSEAKKILNLAQLNASIADTVRLKDRLRFFYHYYDGQWPDRANRRAIYNKIWEITLTKNTLVFDLNPSDANRFEIPE